MDSSETTITYRAIQKRAKDVAQEYMPEFPKQNTFEAWEAFQSEVEALDAYDIAHESSDWDWVIYYGRALELCQAVPSDVRGQAEEELEDMGGQVEPGLYELAASLAALIVTREIAEAVESVKEELIDLAETQLENF